MSRGIYGRVDRCLCMCVCVPEAIPWRWTGKGQVGRVSTWQTGVCVAVCRLWRIMRFQSPLGALKPSTHSHRESQMASQITTHNREKNMGEVDEDQERERERERERETINNWQVLVQDGIAIRAQCPNGCLYFTGKKACVCLYVCLCVCVGGGSLFMHSVCVCVCVCECAFL